MSPETKKRRLEGIPRFTGRMGGSDAEWPLRQHLVFLTNDIIVCQLFPLQFSQFLFAFDSVYFILTYLLNDSCIVKRTVIPLVVSSITFRVKSSSNWRSHRHLYFISVCLLQYTLIHLEFILGV